MFSDDVSINILYIYIVSILYPYLYTYDCIYVYMYFVLCRETWIKWLQQMKFLLKECIWNAFFGISYLPVLNAISLDFVPYSIPLLQLVILCRTSGKLLHEPMITWFTDIDKHHNYVNPYGTETNILHGEEDNDTATDAQGPLLLICFNFNPSMDKWSHDK